MYPIVLFRKLRQISKGKPAQSTKDKIQSEMYFEI